MRAQRWIPVLILFSGCFGACHSATRADLVQDPEPKKAASIEGIHSFEGAWDTTYGPMDLARDGTHVHGTYGGGGESTIEGSQAGARFEFTYVEPSARGAGWFELAPDGTSFAGEWREEGQEDWADWTGARRPGSPHSTDTFSGVWNTKYGLMRLVDDGARVTGGYAFNGRATIEGTTNGSVLTFRYAEPDGTQGEGSFERAADGRSFDGRWRPIHDGKPGDFGTWSGTRVEPIPGRTWLVILEAHWESSLSEHEYSYGEMLRAFFQRVPSVEVRHRFVNDAADLLRFCDELDYVPEPVVLYVSSHGSPVGISVGGGTVDGEQLGAALSHAGDLRLLHLGGCSMMDGDMPARIAAACAPHRRFPISGFKRTADWAGSAVIDFTYLDLVLARGLEPARAVDAVRNMISFAGDDEETGGPIAAAALAIVE